MPDSIIIIWIGYILRSDEKTMAKAAALQSMGFDVRGIRPPSVARGTSRLSDFHHWQCRQEQYYHPRAGASDHRG